RAQGCAIECRVNAEDPANDFRPSPGTVVEAQWPAGEGIRVDTHIASGSRVPPFYDSLMCKIIAHGRDRATALARLREPIPSARIRGVQPNRAFHTTVVGTADFKAGGVDPGFVTRLLEAQAPKLESARHG